MPFLRFMVILVSCGLLLGWVGHRTLKKFNVGAFVGAILGIVIAIQGPVRLWIAGPPESPRVTIDVPADFKHELLIFITDPRVDTEIQWDESRNEARIKAPKSGVIRLQSLGRLDNQLTFARLSNGKTNWGLENMNVRGARLVAYDFRYTPPPGSDLGLMSEDEVAELIRKREAE